MSLYEWLRVLECHALLLLDAIEVGWGSAVETGEPPKGCVQAHWFSKSEGKRREALMSAEAGRG